MSRLTNYHQYPPNNKYQYLRFKEADSSPTNHYFVFERVAISWQATQVSGVRQNRLGSKLDQNQNCLIAPIKQTFIILLSSRCFASIRQPFT